MAPRRPSSARCHPPPTTKGRTPTRPAGGTVSDTNLDVDHSTKACTDRGSVIGQPQRASCETHEVVAAGVAVVIERELALLAPEVRGSADQLEPGGRPNSCLLARDG